MDDYRGDHLGGAAAGADELGALVVPVVARGDLEHHVAVADDAAEFAFLHGSLLRVSGKVKLPECHSDVVMQKG